MDTKDTKDTTHDQGWRFRTPADHLEQAARHLYMSVRPASGLGWYDLSEGQRREYRALIETAQQATDKTPPAMARDFTARDTFWNARGAR